MKQRLLWIVLGLACLGVPEMAEARRGRRHSKHWRGHRHWRGRHWRRPYWGRRHWYGDYWWPSYWNSGIYVGWGFPSYAKRRNWKAIVRKLENEIDDLQDQIDDLQYQLDNAEGKKERAQYRSKIKELQKEVRQYQKDLDVAEGME